MPHYLELIQITKMNKILVTNILILLFTTSGLLAQVGNTSAKNAEDSLNSNNGFQKGTTIGGYGNLRMIRDYDAKTSTVSLERFVLFFGHKFSKKFSLFSELEVEDAKVEPGSAGGEVALEQAYLKYSLDQNNYIVGGLFLPRIGILNENHLPTGFNGNERSMVETLVIPSTWREIGIGYYGNLPMLGINYTLGLVNGLNAAGFEHGSGIREGRAEGRDAGMNNLALSGSIQYMFDNLSVQIAGYYGGTVPLPPNQADSLKLNSGMFATPVAIGEADIKYYLGGFTLRALASIIRIPNAFEINNAFNNNTPSEIYGAYAEVGFDLLSLKEQVQNKKFIVFARYEKLDLNAKIPQNGIYDGTLNQNHLVTGITFLPLSNVVLKADLRFLNTGEENPALNTNQNPFALAYKRSNTFLNLGIGYSF